MTGLPTSNLALLCANLYHYIKDLELNMLFRLSFLSVLCLNFLIFNILGDFL